MKNMGKTTPELPPAVRPVCCCTGPHFFCSEHSYKVQIVLFTTLRCPEVGY